MTSGRSPHNGDPLPALLDAVRRADVERARELFRRHPELRAQINRPSPDLPFGYVPIIPVARLGDRRMIDLFLEAGADINGRSAWWAGGFGVLDLCDPAIAPYLIERGAIVDAHAAARLGMLERLRALVDADPARVHARGGDGQTPLHFAATVEVAAFLLDRGAGIDALDVDHESTPAQWMVRDRPEVARYLVERGCRTDLLMAAALGDLVRTRALLDADPAAIRIRVDEAHFPMRDPRAGGSIYIWTLGAGKSAHAVARAFGHDDVFRLLIERSPADLRLTAAATVGDAALFRALLADHPGPGMSIADEDRRTLADAAQDENLEAVRLMLGAGWPVDARGQHGGTALHWAAWHGHAAMVSEILRHGPSLDLTDADYRATPVGWAIHASTQGWHPERGDYPGTVATLLTAGARAPDPTAWEDASDGVREVLLRHSGAR